MKLHARFPTVLRNQAVDVEIKGDFDPPRVDLRVGFSKNGVEIDMGELSREELAYLCREAARARRHAPD